MVIIRPLALSDKSSIAALLNNKKIWDNLTDFIPYPYSEEDAIQFIEFVANNTLQHVFAIDYNTNFCGVIELVVQQDVYKKSAKIGYWLGEPFWGKGIMTKAVKLITNYGFEELSLVRIFTSVYEYNSASMKVLEKNGYKKEGIFKKAIFKNKALYDEHRYFKLNTTEKIKSSILTD